ncbi:hypothetical protein LINPERHAP1_LOCUS5741 [Linum perenne]
MFCSNVFFRIHHLRILHKSCVISSLVVLLLLLTFRSKHALFHQSSDLSTSSATNISHIGFIVVTSLTTWKHRRPYTDSWWRPNVTRGYVFFDQDPSEFLPWPSTSPPFKINEDITKLQVYPKLVNPIEVRIFRSILDMYRVGDRDLRWFILCDDDTVFFVDNMVEVLGKYDHREYHYIGSSSECAPCNGIYSFDMAFGGAGYALSYALVDALASKLDACIARYHYLSVSDQLAYSCLADFGVSLTVEEGFHQIDLLGDISGFLSSHPQSPALSFHHFDTFDPIFPSMDRYEAVHHLMKPAKIDQSRMLQQTICYQRDKHFSFSVSWGYSVHIYETIIPRSILRNPLETFVPRWKQDHVPAFMFNTRRMLNDPCDTPHVFFFESLEHDTTSYVRGSARGLPTCGNMGSYSGDQISLVRVKSSATARKKVSARG